MNFWSPFKIYVWDTDPLAQLNIRATPRERRFFSVEISKTTLESISLPIVPTTVVPRSTDFTISRTLSTFSFDFKAQVVYFNEIRSRFSEKLFRKNLGWRERVVKIV